MQKTLEKPVKFEGIGLHSGQPVVMILSPAPAGHGIVFVRTDFPAGENEIPALWDRVVDTKLCTVIANGSGARVATIEHVMSALRGCGIDNLRIEIDGPEVPAMDGSALPFVEGIEHAGIAVQHSPARAIRVLKDITVTEGDKSVRLSPSDEAVFGGSIQFDHVDIGRQRFETRLLNGNFRHDIADARTFGFLHEVEWMRRNGLALGGSFDNAIVLNHEGVMNPGGLRRPDEFVRHKILDAIGDLYLAGAPIIGAYHGERAGHALNNALLHKLFSDSAAWVYVPCD